MSVAGLRDLEQGRVASPRPDTLRRLASALGLSDDEADELARARQPATAGPRIDVLGRLSVTFDGTAVALGSHRQRVLLGLLALSANTPVSRDTLIEAAWGTYPPGSAVDLLQTNISRLRRRLQPRHSGADSTRLLIATPGGYQLVVNDTQLDLLTFRRLVSQAGRAYQDGNLPRAIDLYREATGLWHGEPLADLPALHVHPAVVALNREWQTLVLEYASAASDLGRHDDVLPLLQRLTQTETLHEAAHAASMIALAGTGQQAAALAVYDEIRHRLADELGTDPGPELSEAHERVLRQQITRREATPVSARRGLPPDIADFTGRHAELHALHELLSRNGDTETAIAISVIAGMAGVGKTRLATHLAHQLVATGQYHDVQLYVDLHGHAEQPPADPATVLASFLHVLGIQGSQVPASLDERAALYRDQLHDKHALVFLDNAADEDQIRPLLPAGPTNLVLVTTRRTLALDGAITLPLDVFSTQDAHALLAQVAGPDRVAADPATARHVIDLCGRLPIAIALAARRLQTRPAWTLADIASRLEETGDLLGELIAGNRQLRAVFEFSYRALHPDLRTIFRLLGLHPGDEFTADSAAALTDMSAELTRRCLDQLVDEHLLDMASSDRYRLHDLLHDYARQLAETEESEANRDAALERVLDYYLHTTVRAGQLLWPHRTLVDLIGTAPVHVTELSIRDDAKKWLETERPCLTSTVNFAAQRGWPGHAWRLVYMLKTFDSVYGHLDDWERTYRVALTAARAAGEPAGEAATLRHFADALSEQGRSKEALNHLYGALELNRQTGDRTREIAIVNAMGTAYARLSRYPEALQHFRTALSLSKGGHPFWEGLLNANVGTLLVLLGRLAEALDSFQAALTLMQQADNRHREVGVLAHIGDVYRRLGRYEDAQRHLDQALLAATEHGLRRAGSYASYRLGQTYRELGQLDRALEQLGAALDVVRSTGVEEVTESAILIDLGAVYRDADDLDTAHDLLRQALAVAIETRERYQEARALDGLAHVRHRAGRTDLADEHWQQAKNLFTELGTAEADQSPVRP